MKNLVRLLIAAPIVVCAAALAAEPVAKYPGHVIPNSQLRVLPKSPSGRQYQLHIGLPESYAKNPNRKYPVVYVTDAYWDFQKITASEGSLWYDRVVPEFITVGIGYPGEDLDYGKMRVWELSPVALGNSGDASGHAAEFLASIEQEIIPFVEREYRADPSFRVMSGSSLGGLFTLYAMFTKPALFQGYIAATPAVVVGDDWLMTYEEKFAQTHRAIRARLFMAGGGNELPSFLGGIIRMNQRISSRQYDGLAYEFRYIDGERHGGMQEESYTRGLRFVLAPLAPESGPVGGMR